jgi:L-alanine-DL-glutamate epimerase-like enolase superfamily enzyme
LRRIALMAQEHNLVFSPHTWGNGIVVIGNAHLAAGLADVPYLEFPYDPPEWDLDRRDCPLAEPFRMDEAGWIRLTETPGMGIVLDEAVLARTRIG